MLLSANCATKPIQDEFQCCLIFVNLISISLEPALFSRIIAAAKSLSGPNNRVECAAIILMACRKAFNVEDPTVDIQKKLSKYKEVLQGSEYARPLFAYLYDLLKSGITKKDEILLSLGCVEKTDLKLSLCDLK